MKLRAYYGDLSTPRVFAIDVNTMSRLVSPDIEINAPAYPIDKINDKLLLGITRGEKSVTPINLDSRRAGKPIALDHKPRSTTVKGGLCLIAGADQPVTSVVEVKASKVLQVVGQPTAESDTDFGGGLASGHPIWVHKNHFLLLDRRRRSISLFKVGSSLPAKTIRTPTSCHHVEVYDKGYVALCEGNPASEIPPALVFFCVSTGKVFDLAVSKVLFMPSAEGGAHHIEIIDKTIYVPTSNGVVFVITETHSSDFKFSKPIMAGKGAGHVVVNPKSPIGAIVNHNDEFITLFDQKKNVKIANVKVASPPPTQKKSQAHTAKLSPNGKYFYGAASQDGEFFRVDLARRKKDKVLNLNTFGFDAQPLQGVIF